MNGMKKKKHYQPPKANYFEVLQPFQINSIPGIPASVLNVSITFAKTTYLSCNIYRKIIENYLRLTAI